MKRFFFRKMGHGYMDAVEPLNSCWSYLFSREWCYSTGDVLFACVLLTGLILITPFAYLCVAPVTAILEGMREEEG